MQSRAQTGVRPRFCCTPHPRMRDSACARRAGTRAHHRPASPPHTLHPSARTHPEEGVASGIDVPVDGIALCHARQNVAHTRAV
eukprot:1059146-Pleurochrysis_carterae.AAC.1